MPAVSGRGILWVSLFFLSAVSSSARTLSGHGVIGLASSHAKTLRSSQSKRGDVEVEAAKKEVEESQNRLDKDQAKLAEAESRVAKLEKQLGSDVHGKTRDSRLEDRRAISKQEVDAAVEEQNQATREYNSQVSILLGLRRALSVAECRLESIRAGGKGVGCEAKSGSTLYSLSSTVAIALAALGIGIVA
eukprot:TRINITY_DN4837_c0_g3_i2.p1 TRINITY_DN4837_c0_g3~~TRINITY_DN4837_c0_g3_i2.p1  ORF type:complete len:190 (-),score=35.48 TRINITY_DN4837_c0_g3_i2:234-803(-)